MNKTISINPELFKISNARGSRKKLDDTGGVRNTPIKVKTPREKTKTLRKNHILKFIRDQQENNYKKLLENGSTNTSANTNVDVHNNSRVSNTTFMTSSGGTQDFNNDFDETLKYFSSLSEENAKKQSQPKNSHNHTLRNYSSGGSSQTPSSFYGSENVSLDMPSDLLNTFQLDIPSNCPVMQLAKPSAPNWGCLKNGNLPTYRNWRNSTQRNFGGGSIPPMSQSLTSQPIIQKPVAQPSVPNLNGATMSQIHELNSRGGSQTPLFQTFSQKDQHRMNNSTLKQMMQRNVTETQKPKLRYPKQQRTVRRTYTVGKSKKQPKIGVLVSNKTLRSRVTEKTQLLKQTPIDEVRRYLVKKGFIKVGSIAPNDVLRKMHETALLMCGEIQNHNPENLLYNFLNEASSRK
jgi:hypothetical protein